MSNVETMTRTRLFTLVVIAATALSANLSTAHAAVTPLLNGSFENPTSTDSPRVTGPVDFWDDNNTVGPTYSGNQLRDDATSPVYADPTDGTRFLALEATFGGVSSGVQQDIGTMVAGETYTLTADMLSFSEQIGGFTQVHRYTIAFYNVTDATLLDSINETDFATPQDTTSVTPATLSYTALAGDAGDVLRVVLAAGATGGSEYSRVGIDDVVVAVQGSQIPTPAALPAGIALLTILGMRRKRRR